MLLTYIVYLLIIFIVLWKCKFAGFNDDFNEDFLNKNSTKSICGLSALFIIFHHISQRPAFQDATKELFFFNGIGFLAVTVFLFFSGYGLTTKAKSDDKYIKTFLKKRLITVLLPFYLTNIIFAIINIGKMPWPRILLGIFGFVNINPNGWYPVVQIILYLSFYVGNKFFKKDSSKILLDLAVVCLMICVFCINGHFAWWKYPIRGWWLNGFMFDRAPWWAQSQVLLFSGEWWVNSAIAFVLGVILGTYKNKLINWFKKKYYIKLVVSIILFVLTFMNFNYVNSTRGYWSEMWNMVPKIDDKFITSLAQLLTCVFFITSLILIMMKFRSENPITKFMGKITYETYLIGPIFLDLFNSIILNGEQPIVKAPYNHNLIIYALCVTVTTILFGWIINKFDNYLIDKINTKR